MVIDISLLLHKSLISIRNNKFYKETDHDHISAMIRIVAMFLNKNIIPICVFDGKPPEMKKSILMRRKNTIKTAIETCNRLKQEGNEMSDEYVKNNKKIVYINKKMILECKRFLTLCKIPFYHNETIEADPYCAYLLSSRSDIINGIISDDSDMILHGGNSLITKYNVYSNSYLEINISDILHFLQEKAHLISLIYYTPEIHIDFNKFVDFSLVLGSSYQEGIKTNKGNEGRNKLFELFIINNCDVDKLLENVCLINKQFDNIIYTIPNDFKDNWRHAKNIYTRQQQYDDMILNDYYINEGDINYLVNQLKIAGVGVHDINVLKFCLYKYCTFSQINKHLQRDEINITESLSDSVSITHTHSSNDSIKTNTTNYLDATWIDDCSWAITNDEIDNISLSNTSNIIDIIENSDNKITKCNNIIEKFDTIITHSDNIIENFDDKITKCDNIVENFDDKITKCDNIIENFDNKITKCDNIIENLDNKITKCDNIIENIDNKITKCDNIIENIDNKITKCNSIDDNIINSENIIKNSDDRITESNNIVNSIVKNSDNINTTSNINNNKVDNYNKAVLDKSDTYYIKDKQCKSQVDHNVIGLIKKHTDCVNNNNYMSDCTTTSILKSSSSSNKLNCSNKNKIHKSFKKYNSTEIDTDNTYNIKSSNTMCTKCTMCSGGNCKICIKCNKHEHCRSRTHNTYEDRHNMKHFDTSYLNDTHEQYRRNNEMNIQSNKHEQYKKNGPHNSLDMRHIDKTEGLQEIISDKVKKKYMEHMSNMMNIINSFSVYSCIDYLNYLKYLKYINYKKVYVPY